MRLTTEELVEIRDGCAGVTPGPWESDGVKNDGFTSYEITDSHGRSVADTYNAGTIEVQEDDGRAWDEQGRKNMAHIARLSPERVSALITEVLELRAGGSQAARDVLAERERQKSVEGWTANGEGR